MTLPKIPESTGPEGNEMNVVIEGKCVIYVFNITEGIAHRDGVEELTWYRCKIVELKMTHADLNCARAIMEKSVVHYIGFNVQHIWYACIYIIQASGKYIGQSRFYHVIMRHRYLQ